MDWFFDLPVMLLGVNSFRYSPPAHTFQKSAASQTFPFRASSIRRVTALLAAAAASTAAAAYGRGRSKRLVSLRRALRRSRSIGGLSPASTALPLLVLVAALYGSLGICIRVMYSLPGPPTPAALSLVRQVLTVVVFIPVMYSSGAGSVTEGVFRRSFWACAAELAAWDLGAQGLMNVGLLFTSATRASFFAQLSLVVTPVLSLLNGQSVASATWFGCAVATFGTLLLGADGTAHAEPSVSADVPALGGFNLGDLLCCGAATAWSAYIYRISSFSRLKLPSVPLQAAKTALLAVFYAGWLVVDMALLRQCAFADLWPGWNSAIAWSVLLFSAIGPGALGDVWMQHASDKVCAATANVVLSTEPIFAAVFGSVFLGEHLGRLGLAGGACIFVAAVIAGACDKKDEAEVSEKPLQDFVA
eukprot:TRINITY_DN98882_c0_g1_i1.p1 TRINITY_DN98882_c0_g1~~TRINITY_DN98882_c0_g1_i1.p1  ORF type:complete len:430 (-),score=91.45 TRINITY_DN98882_c0_g1_i1:38-1288(-)